MWHIEEVKATFRPWLAGEGPCHLSSCSLGCREGQRQTGTVITMTDQSGGATMHRSRHHKWQKWTLVYRTRPLLGRESDLKRQSGGGRGPRTPPCREGQPPIVDGSGTIWSTFTVYDDASSFRYTIVNFCQQVRPEATIWW